MTLRVLFFFRHLAISLGIAGIVVWLIFWEWYPSPLHKALAVTDIFLLLLAVDVVLGPCLTLLVCKAGKKNLYFDLAVIFSLQLAALGYGLWTVAQARPAWLVFNVDRFDLVQVIDIDADSQARAAPAYRQPGWLGPQWVAALPPVDRAERNRLVFESAMGGSDLPQRPDLYVPLEQVSDELARQVSALDSLRRFNDAERVNAVLGAWPQARGWLPLMARAQPMVVLMGPEPAQVLAVVALKPWE